MEGIHNSMQNEPQSDVATVHSEVSLTYTVESMDKPLNCFRNQIILEEASQPSWRNFISFGSKTRYIIHSNNKDSLLELVKEVVNVNVAIHCDLHTLAIIQHALVLEFPATKFFAATYAKAVEQRNQNTDFHKGQQRVPEKQGKYLGNDRGQEKNPHFFKKQNKNQSNDYWRRQDNWADRDDPEQSPEPSLDKTQKDQTFRKE